MNRMMANHSNPLGAGTVHFVGAGPGAPELLTVKAYTLLRRADVILHDDLVAGEIVSFAGPHAEVLNVGKRCGEKKITQAEINSRMIEAARRGFEVIRLKSGDPGIFGRLAEEIEALEAAGIPFDVVPGITAGVAAASALGASLTDRRKSSRIVIVSGHHAPDADWRNSRADWSSLASDDTTFIIYMPGRELARMQRELLDAGLAPDFPAVLVSRVSSPGQCQWPTTVAELDKIPPLEAPTILLLGRSILRAANSAASGLLSAIVEDSDCSWLANLA
jgi:uroporphyrin-III C-methyltransferase